MNYPGDMNGGGWRCVTKFLWFPKRLRGQWRWLKWTGVNQVSHMRSLRCGFRARDGGFVPRKEVWVDVSWFHPSVCLRLTRRRA